MLDLVTLLFHLVAPDHEFQVVGLQEVVCHILSECDADPALRRRAALAALRVAPQHLRHEALVGGLAVAVHLPDGVEGDVVRREEAPVNHEDLLVDDVAERQEAERLAEERVQVLVELFGYLALEAVELVHVSRLMIAPRKVHVLRVAQLPREQDQDHLGGERAAVDEVPVEQVRVVLRREAVDLPNVQQVVVLAVHVTADCELLVLRHVNVDQRRQVLEQLDHVEHDRVGVLLGYGLFLPLPLHQLLAKLRRHLAALVHGPAVLRVYVHAAQDHRLAHGLRLVARNRKRELLLLHLFLAGLELLPCVLVARRQLAQLREVLQGILRAPQGQVGGAPSVVALREVWLRLYRLRSVRQSGAVALHLQVAEGAVRVVDLDVGVLFLHAIEGVQAIVVGAIFAELDRNRVGNDSLYIVVLLEELVALIFGLFCPREGSLLCSHGDADVMFCLLPRKALPNRLAVASKRSLA
mmetsp:Transcript_7011/g.19921  ORF Transcript_7011/g.19921 Transcript_7011/m.19921 type:complete len:468 (-) Transcript_7011:31-1434(-)